MTEVRTIAAQDDLSHVAVIGRLDFDGVGAVEVQLTAATVARRRPVIVDMSAVEFLGSLGIGLLVRCAVSLQRSGKPLILFGCQPLVRKTLETARVTSVLPLADDEGSARQLATAEQST